ncbi:hypothetical protein [Verrucosispora sp. NA02020]|uniref:hypothetical protein n=1 Tax=Verrucosispora sp. NA02020 TaxID=2742132 RepID=UPI003D71E551
MTDQQHESRWSLNHTGNRVFVAAVAGLLAGCIAGSGGATGGLHILAVLVTAVIAYVLLTVLRPR